MGRHIFKIMLCSLKTSIHAAWFEIQYEVHHVFMSQKLKKLKEEDSQPFGPSCAADSLTVVSTPPSSMLFLNNYLSNVETVEHRWALGKCLSLINFCF